jgi:AcrR family transcriptional regulator
VATRGRLIEAAGAALVERGLAGAGTAAIAERAGVSQGALFKHFPQKSQLLGAAVAGILAGYVGDFRADVVRRLGVRAAAAAPPARDPRIPEAVAALWQIFRHPGMGAVFEVYVAARTDRALEAELAPVLQRHREAILVQARLLFPELSGQPDFDSAVDAVVYAMQGVALGVFAPDARAEEQHLAFLERLAQHELLRLGAAAHAPTKPSTEEPR